MCGRPRPSNLCGLGRRLCPRRLHSQRGRPSRDPTVRSRHRRRRRPRSRAGSPTIRAVRLSPPRRCAQPARTAANLTPTATAPTRAQEHSIHAPLRRAGRQHSGRRTPTLAQPPKPAAMNPRTVQINQPDLGHLPPKISSHLPPKVEEIILVEPPVRSPPNPRRSWKPGTKPRQAAGRCRSRRPPRKRPAAPGRWAVRSGSATSAAQRSLRPVSSISLGRGVSATYRRGALYRHTSTPAQGQRNGPRKECCSSAAAVASPPLISRLCFVDG